MIVVPQNQLKFLLAGRALTIVVRPPARPYRKQTPYAAGVNHKASICHVEILESQLIDGEGLQVKIRRINAEQPHFLAARSEYGYTSNAYQAMRDEPEPVTGDALKRLTNAAAQRFEQERSNELQRQRIRSLNHRLREAQRLQDADAIADIRRDLEILEQQMRSAA